MAEFSSCLKMNEIHLVYNHFNEDSQNIIFFPGMPNLWGGMAKKFGENWQWHEWSIVMQLGVVNFETEYQPLPPGTKILVMHQFSYMSDQILGEKLNF